ncbi:MULTISPECIES: ABC transporter permease [Paenibacillus]|uniref:ABC transporter permease n=1 Tax=Paenibacillus cucumis (ex Kampfer et al. 2016) TaxID=1776858 RepID=A0ABS7KIA0_9BACL|nr:ABC transporter permease [Paenibacillus cucumis (ex Kampfer et al. 2016)]MBY0203696.1 ABC transporter permease [Paenibacillus cucumis (ex Kampfer et al. 2016)]MDP9702162.1 ABC-type transport system involved in multi-copper enzyme maturation permease subunit [Paenibacillus intestini]
MNSFLRSVRFELNKIISMRLWWIICVIALGFQPLSALIAARSYLKIGLDATPETQPGLVSALPSLDYLGFELAPFGVLLMIVFGGVIGGSEYLHHQLRTTLLCQSSRVKVFGAKVLAVAVCALFISSIAVYLTISVMHLTLGDQGLHPIFLSPIAWQYIGYVVLDWILLTILSFGLGMVFKNAIVPLAFLIPQVYNLGLYLAQKWEWGIYLPVAAGNLLFASPTDPFEHDPLKGVVILLLWVIVALSTSYYTFIRSDVGGKY